VIVHHRRHHLHLRHQVVANQKVKNDIIDKERMQIKKRIIILDLDLIIKKKTKGKDKIHHLNHLIQVLLQKIKNDIFYFLFSKFKYFIFIKYFLIYLLLI